MRFLPFSPRIINDARGWEGYRQALGQEPELGRAALDAVDEK